MWPFDKKTKNETAQQEQTKSTDHATVADGIDWRQIYSEGKCMELIDGCRAKSDGIFGDV